MIQVLLGPRQVGKTTGILRIFNSWPGKKHFVSADDTLQASQIWLTEQWQIASNLGEGSLLVIDEVQRVPDWSKVIKGLWDRSLRNKKNLRVVLLGSSSLSIQRGLSESLAGRFELTTVPHWGFHECQREFNYTLDEWLIWGGYPGAETYRGQDARWRSYLTSSIVDAFIGREILTQKVVRNQALFRQAFAIACAYPAQEISYSKLLGQLQDAGNTDLVKSYLELYEGAFLLFSIQKYAKKPRISKLSTPKLILGCPALANLALGLDYVSSSEGKGRVFESAVGMDLLRIPGGAVFWWRDGNDEVDFIFKMQRKLFAVEVKSGRRKRTGGIEAFLKIEKSAVPCFITPENYSVLSWQVTAGSSCCRSTTSTMSENTSANSLRTASLSYPVLRIMVPRHRKCTLEAGCLRKWPNYNAQKSKSEGRDRFRICPLHADSVLRRTAIHAAHFG